MTAAARIIEETIPLFQRLLFRKSIEPQPRRRDQHVLPQDHAV
jgi:hypothetical protein